MEGFRATATPCPQKIGAPRFAPHESKLSCGISLAYGDLKTLDPLFSFGLLGIEPSLHAPKACVLPVYYSPYRFCIRGFFSGQYMHDIIKMMVVRDILQQLNVRAQCRRYGVPLLQCPHFLFIIIGTVIIFSSVFTYAIGIRYIEDPQIVAVGVLFLATVLLVIGFSITQGFERLAEASRLKSEFISIVSHQLRTPLTNLRWSVDMLISGRLDGIVEKQREYFNIVDENAARMNALVQDLLMVSRIERGRLPVHPQEISLPEFIKETMKRFEHSAAVSQVELSLQVNSSAEDMSKITTDPSQLKIILENLIENAVRYSKSGRKVRIALSKQNKNLRVEVQDEGIGIPLPDQKFIFQKFFRADNARTKQPTGTGLGLNITKMLVQNLGGQIGFRSQENKGSTFWFTIPIT